MIDFDPPSDTLRSRDVFIAMKTLDPTIRGIICTRNPQSRETQELQFKGAYLVPKPLFWKQARMVVEEWIQKGRWPQVE